MEKTNDKGYRVEVYIPRDEDFYNLYEYIGNIEKYICCLSDIATDKLHKIRQVAPDLNLMDKESLYLQWITDHIDGNAQIHYRANIKLKRHNIDFKKKSKVIHEEDIPF